jgi:hypothetical protein
MIGDAAEEALHADVTGGDHRDRHVQQQQDDDSEHTDAQRGADRPQLEHGAGLLITWSPGIGRGSMIEQRAGPMTRERAGGVRVLVR